MRKHNKLTAEEIDKLTDALLDTTDEEWRSSAGRPTTYKPEYCKKIIEYFNIDLYTKTQLRDGTVHMEACDFPSMEGFAYSIGVHRRTLQNWTKNYAAFDHAYKMALDRQEEILMINGLHGSYSPAFAGVIGKAKGGGDGWTEKTEEVRTYTLDEQSKEILSQIGITVNEASESNTGKTDS